MPFPFYNREQSRVSNKKMSNINLTVNNNEEINGGILKSAQFALIGILALLIIAYGVLFFLLKLTNSKIEQLDMDYMMQKKALVGTGNNNGEVYDLQKRIVLSKNLIENKDVRGDLIAGLEKSMIDGVLLSSLEYTMDDSSVIIEGNANNLYDLAKQVLNFKNSDIFGGVIGDIETSTGKNSGIDFSLTLKINNLKT